MTEFNVGKLDSIIHGRIRLGIMASLASSETATFVQLKGTLQATQGNLSIQLKKLEEAGYISTSRRLKGKKTETTARLTQAGKKAFSDYLARMETLINQTKQ
jgi:DNA-binding MarR family transcriptional regulator